LIILYSTYTNLLNSMNKLLRPYLAFLLMGTLLFSTSCSDDDDPGPIDEGEVITTVTLSLSPTGKGQDAEATITTLSGSPVQNTPLALKSGTEYTAVITLSDESKTPAVDRTDEIRQKGNEHLFVFTASPNSLLTINATDTDSNGRPIGLESTVVAGSEGTGTLRVVLKHQPGNLKTGTNTTAGETDVDVSFSVIVSN
jgi:hypothetical protein